MPVLKRFVATIYRTYVKRGDDIAYFRTISTIVFCIWLHLIQIGLIVGGGLVNYITPFNSHNKIIQWFQAAFFFLALIVIFSLLFPKKSIQEQQVSDDAILRARKIIPWYVAGTVSLFTVLMVIYGIRKGTIHL